MKLSRPGQILSQLGSYPREPEITLYYSLLACLEACEVTLLERKAVPIHLLSNWGTSDDIVSAALTLSSHGTRTLTPHNENCELMQSQPKGMVWSCRATLTHSLCLGYFYSIQFPPIGAPGMGTSPLPNIASGFGALSFRTRFSKP